nr:hypothetical protein [Sphingomonas vulcanisoli]
MTRAYLLWPATVAAVRGFAVSAAPTPAFETFATAPPFEPAARGIGVVTAMRTLDWAHGVNAARLWLLQQGGGEALSTEHALRRATFAYLPPAEDREEAPPSPFAPVPLFPQQRGTASRIEAQAYFFWRPGAGTPGLAERAELGGSQFAARIAVPLSRDFAAAARVYAPLEHGGAETAFGIDWHPLPGRPLRISVERRQRLDRLGRSAWSAYAAGGFWRGGGPGSAQIDGYAQAGVVGTQRRDLFIDGALRIGYRLPTPKTAITLGAGLWGAAQPQVARLDAGPRMAIVLPIDHHNVTLAIDGRFRLAGHAAPGSGAALTLGADF